MIQVARVVGLEVSLANLSILEDLLQKSNLISKGGDGCKGYGMLPFSSRAGTSVGDSVASRSIYSLPLITESTQS